MYGHTHVHTVVCLCMYMVPRREAARTGSCDGGGAGRTCTGCGPGWTQKRLRDTGVPARTNLSADYWMGGWVCAVHCRALLIRIKRSGYGCNNAAADGWLVGGFRIRESREGIDLMTFKYGTGAQDSFTRSDRKLSICSTHFRL